ncbi:MAG: hypothetical protein SOY42_03850 [Clostridium sp.]|nr:hypothetical protein [Clostridium sp.]
MKKNISFILGKKISIKNIQNTINTRNNEKIKLLHKENNILKEILVEKELEIFMLKKNE